MLVVGLTGGIGSGKSTVAELFNSYHICQVDADVISRVAVAKGQPALAEIVTHFGANIIDEAGDLDRPALRQIIFENPTEKTWLESLLHPIINSLIKSSLAQCQSPYSMLISPLLLETSQHELVDRVLVIDVSRETQIKRTIARDASKLSVVEAIIDSQIDRDQRRQLADEIVNNDRDPAALVPQVEQLHEKYMQLAEHESKR